MAVRASAEPEKIRPSHGRICHKNNSILKFKRGIELSNEARACYLDMGFVLNGQPNGQKFPGYDRPGDYTPEVRQDYVLPEWAKTKLAELTAPRQDEPEMTGMTL